MLRGWGGILNAPGTRRRAAKEHEQNEYLNGGERGLPEMESSVSVALSYSLSSESVDEREV